MVGKALDAVCIGTCMMDISTYGIDPRTFFVNEPNRVDAITYSVGGDAVNEAIILARMGNRVALQSRVGDDFVGRFVTETARNNGVDVSGITRDASVPTAANNILIGAGDVRVYNVCKGGTSNDEFCGSDIDLDVVRAAKLVSLGSLFVHAKLDEPVLTELFSEAKKAGAITCADVSLPQDGSSLAALQRALPYLDYIFPNETEAAFFSQKEDPDGIADYFLGLGIGTVVVKLGAKGCLVKNKEARFFQKRYTVEPVDTTGAGDNFAAGFMWGLIRGLPLRECARYAAAGALAVQKVGATAGVQSGRQVEEFLRAIER